MSVSTPPSLSDAASPSQALLASKPRTAGPQSSRVLVPVAAGLAAGVAAWCTLGVLDLTSDNDRLVPVAMLPSLLEAVWLMAAGALGCHAFVVTCARTRQFRAKQCDSAHDALLPLFGALILVLPYVPGLPDRWPALTVLAGPVRVHRLARRLHIGFECRCVDLVPAVGCSDARHEVRKIPRRDHFQPLFVHVGDCGTPPDQNSVLSRWRRTSLSGGGAKLVARR